MLQWTLLAACVGVTLSTPMAQTQPQGYSLKEPAVIPLELHQPTSTTTISPTTLPPAITRPPALPPKGPELSQLYSTPQLLDQDSAAASQPEVIQQSPTPNDGPPSPPDVTVPSPPAPNPPAPSPPAPRPQITNSPAPILSSTRPPTPSPPTQRPATPSPSPVRPTTSPSVQTGMMMGMPYEFEFAINDVEGRDDGGVIFSHQESSDGTITMGEYRVLMPDGRLQVVTFMDRGQGYEAKVTYQK